MFVTMPTFLGFVGLTAIVSSDSFKWRWLTSTFCGMNGRAAAPAWATRLPPATLATSATIRAVTSRDDTKAAANGPRRMFLLLHLHEHVGGSARRPNHRVLHLLWLPYMGQPRLYAERATSNPWRQHSMPVKAAWHTWPALAAVHGHHVAEVCLRGALAGPLMGRPDDWEARFLPRAA